MAWRSEARGKAYKAQLGESNRRTFKTLVESGIAHGVLAFDGKRPIGWCSVGPRSTFPKLQRSRALQTDADEHTWSITCFFVHKEYRGTGIATRMGEEAVRVANGHGATGVEGYPAVVYDVAHGLPAAFAWTGIAALFKRLKFTRLRRVGRPIYRKDLRGRARRRHAES
jgi:GNAT superfamily N-acetyltransferase